MLHSLAHQGISQGGLPADRRARARRRSSRRPSPTPSRRCAARPCSPRSSRPRGSSRPTATSSRRCRPRPRARARRPRSCSSTCEKAGRLDELREDLAQRAGDRPARRARDADLRRAGPGAREAVDPADKAAPTRPRRAVGRPARDDRPQRPSGSRGDDRPTAAGRRPLGSDLLALPPPAGIRADERNRSEDHEPPCPHGRRADVARRARVRHLLAACSTSGSSSSARPSTTRSPT